MQRGFIQIPILIVIIVAAILGGGGYVAYEVTKSSQNTSPKEAARETEVQATTTVNTFTESQNSREQTKVAVAKPACTISVSPATINQGEKATLIWSTSGIISDIPDAYIAVYKVTGDILTPAMRNIKLNDSTVVSPFESTRYTLIAPNPYFFCKTVLTVVSAPSVQANSAPQISTAQTNFERPIGAPSVEQLRELMWFCGYTPDLEKSCAADKFMEGYFTNASFRSLTDKLIVYFKQKLAEQQVQNETARQAYLQYLQYKSYTPPATPPRIETYSIPVYSGGLKLDIPPVETNRRWEIQWTGDGGGFITNSGGNTTHFQCLTGRCFSL